MGVKQHVVLNEVHISDRDEIDLFRCKPLAMAPLLLELKVNSVLLVAEFMDFKNASNNPVHCYVLRSHNTFDWDIINPGCDSE
jgi:hypothetical protein